MANNKSFGSFITLMQMVSCVYDAWHINKSIISGLLLALSQTCVYFPLGKNEFRCPTFGIYKSAWRTWLKYLYM